MRSTTAAAAPVGLVYRVLVRQVVTKARVAGLGALAVFLILLGWAGGRSDPTMSDAVGLIGNLGLAVILPIGSLIFASGTLADLREDRTLVYLWLRPMQPWVVPVAALGAALTPVLPITVVAGALAAAATGVDSSLITGAVIAMSMGAVAYCAVFVAFGLLVKRTLLWGLMYILIWEGFIAGGGQGAAKLAIRAYTRSIVARATDVDISLADFSMATSAIVLVCVAIGSMIVARLRYARMDVD